MEQNALKEIDLEYQRKLTEIFKRITIRRLHLLNKKSAKINQELQEGQSNPIAFSDQEITLITIMGILQYYQHDQLTDSMLSRTNDYIHNLIQRVPSKEKMMSSELNEDESKQLGIELIVLSTLPLLIKKSEHYTSGTHHNPKIMKDLTQSIQTLASKLTSLHYEFIDKSDPSRSLFEKFIRSNFYLNIEGMAQIQIPFYQRRLNHPLPPSDIKKRNPRRWAQIMKWVKRDQSPIKQQRTDREER